MSAMGKLGRGRVAIGAALAAVVALGVAFAASHRLRDGAVAAYRAFRDPSRVRLDADHGDHGDDAPLLPPATEIEQPEIGLDFDRATDADFGDAGSLEQLTLPDLPIPITKRTLQFISYFANSAEGRKAFIERLRRGGRYKPQIEQALRDQSVPEDLLWLVGIESAFNPQAVSPKGATGLFQFMPETAEKYGLAMDNWIDERRSIPRASAAGAQHLRDLFEHYGRWDLALAAYNYGKDPLDAAIEKLKSRRGERNVGKPVEFKDLAESRLIPKETANFVPQIQAFAIVAANRGRFGLDDLDIQPPLDAGELVVPQQTPLRLVAKAAGVSVTTLRELNPDLLRDKAPPGSDAIVLVPADKLDRAVAAFPALYAREVTSASGLPEPPPLAPPRERGKGASSSSAAEPPIAALPPPPRAPGDRSSLEDGLVVERREAPGPSESIGAHVEMVEPSRGGPRPTGKAWDVPASSVADKDAARGVARVADAVKKLVRANGAASVELRKHVAEGDRRALEKAPYGAGWLALGDALFGDGPMSGAALVSPTKPLASVLFADLPRGGFRVTLKVEGPVSRERIDGAARASFARLFDDGLEAAPPGKDERLSASGPITSPRLLVGWIAPPEGAAEEPALRLALVLLANHQTGRLARALVERSLASHLRGTLDLGDRASVAALEIEPAVPHDADEVLRELDKALEASAEGATAADVATAKEKLRVYLRAERARGGRPGE
ncbi:MAG TPA: lytic transglycosylase domain-containing protein, partial [Byssovorax sp.]